MFRSLKQGLAQVVTGLFLVGCSTSNTLKPPEEAIRLPAGFEYPNGITSTPDGRLFVGSITSGEIIKIEPSGQITSIFSGSNESFAGTALEYDPSTGLLWVASPDFLGREIDGEIVRRPNRLNVIDPIKGKVVHSYRLPDDVFINDIALDTRGGVYLTDSWKDLVWHVKNVGGEFEKYAASKLMTPGDLGPAGIVRMPNGDLIISLYHAGELLHISDGGKRVEPILVDKELFNPDGLEVSGSGELLLVTGNVESGNGKLLRIDLESQIPHNIEVIGENLSSPVNLTKVGGSIYVSESSIRHRILKDKTLPKPTRWALKKYVLNETHGETERIAILPDQFYPESIARDVDGNYYLGSATRSEIIKVTENGNSDTLVASGSNGLMSVQGLLVNDVKQQLYACTADLGQHSGPTSASALLAFDIETGKALGRWSLDEKGFCNDLVQLRSGKILISDTATHRIWEFDPSGVGKLSIWAEHPLLAGAPYNGNGITISADEKSVYLSTFADGRILKVNRSKDGKSGEITELTLSQELDGADALRILPDDQILVFENGLINGQSKISIGAIDKNHVVLSTIATIPNQATSGVVEDNCTVWAASNFKFIFSTDPNVEKPYDRGLFRTCW